MDGKLDTEDGELDPDRFINIFHVVQGRKLTRDVAVRECLTKDNRFSITKTQRAINQMLESRLLRSSGGKFQKLTHQGSKLFGLTHEKYLPSSHEKLFINKKFNSDIETIIKKGADKELIA
jgi:hypothetical protein